MIQEADAAAVVADMMLVLGARGYNVAITDENGPRLLRLGALLLAEFGIADCEGASSGACDERTLPPKLTYRFPVGPLG